MNDLKICSKCNIAKDIYLFYCYQGRFRSECKSCTIKKNVRHQKKNRSWKNRFVDNDEKRSYMTEYYAKNREKFAEYRKKFRMKHPDYHKLYARKRKNEVWKSEAAVNNSAASGHNTKTSYKGVA